MGLLYHTISNAQKPKLLEQVQHVVRWFIHLIAFEHEAEYLVL